MAGPPDRSVRYFGHLSLFVLIVVYLALRLGRLTLLPVFNDEAFYLHWAAIIHDDPGSIWLPLVDGKTPLSYWVNALTIGWFTDPLVSGRIVSVISGMATVAMFYLMGLKLKRPVAGLIAGGLYTLLPYAFFNDRLATVDSFHTALVVACLYATVRACTAEAFSYGSAVLIGATLSAAFMAKTPALLIMPLPFLAVILVRSDGRSRATLIKLFLSFSVLALIAIVYLTRDVPMIGSGGSKIFHRARFFIPPAELLAAPFGKWLGNLKDFGGYVYSYFTPALALAGVVAFVSAICRKNRIVVLISLWTIVPVAAMLLLTKETFSRYYLFALTPALIVIGIESENLFDWARKQSAGKKALASAAWAVVMCAALLQSVLFIAAYLKNPAGVKWFARDRMQYIEGYPSGYGIDSIVKFIEGRAQKGNVTVFTTMSWGNPADAVWIYLRREPKVRIVECFWWQKAPILPPGNTEIPAIKSKFQRYIVGNIPVDGLGEAYFVVRSQPFSMEAFSALNPNAKLVMETTRPGGEIADYLFRIN